MANIGGLIEKYKTVPNERFFRELFQDQEYLPARAVKADVVLDVGALAGEFCAYIYEHAQTIYALEPDPRFFKELSENVKEFKLTKVKPYQLALGGASGMRNFHASNDRGGSQLREGGGDEGVVQAQTKTLAQFLNDEGIEKVDILKIDVENGEGEIFGATDFPSVASRIEYIIGEHLAGVDHILKELGFDQLESYKNNLIYQRHHAETT